ncbi:FAD-dependent thymidylate synthase [Gorillibacterium sp. sgz5001074]|uniref:FAD-dependent thymidylate synthase n=1 Tax=Gorillibacterium sp. sgz5001074 TaxID=3446695 RepID=UPI003F67EB6C
MGSQKRMNVELLSYTPNARKIAFTAIRTCYSPSEPSDLFEGAEYERYQEQPASDGQEGSDADRLFRHIINSGHTSTLEHISFTFAIEGVSRVLLAQLTRHRVGFGFSVQSQRYVSDASDKKKGGFQYVVPPKIGAIGEAAAYYEQLMGTLQEAYDKLVELGVPKEDARFVLPNGAATNMTMTANLRALLSFYSKRKPGRGAQWEIAELAEELRRKVVEAEPWLDAYFEQA